MHFVLLRWVYEAAGVDLGIFGVLDGGYAPCEGFDEIVGVGNMAFVSVGQSEGIEKRLKTICRVGSARRLGHVVLTRGFLGASSGFAIRLLRERGFRSPLLLRKVQ